MTDKQLIENYKRLQPASWARFEKLEGKASISDDDFNFLIRLLKTKTGGALRRIAGHEDLLTFLKDLRKKRVYSSSTPSFSHLSSDPLAYMREEKGRWSGYDPSSGPLGDMVRDQIRHEKWADDWREHQAKKHKRELEKNRYDTMMKQDWRQPLSTGGDTWRYQIGEDTGVHDDFEYLRQQEADQNAFNVRMSIKKRARKAEVMRAGLDDYGKFIHANQSRMGKQGADEAYRKIMLKELPGFFKNSKISTKVLSAVASGYGRLKKMPVIGQLAKHPYIASAMMAIGGLKFLAGKNDAANEDVTNAQNAINLYGRPSKKFMNSALNAGYKDVGKISQFWGKLTAKYGDAESIIMGLGPQMRGMSPLERMNIAASLGLNADEMALFDIMSENGRISGRNTSARRKNARLNRLQALETLQLSSNSGFWAKFKGIGNKIADSIGITALWNSDSPLLSWLRNEDAAEKEFQDATQNYLGEGLQNAEKAHEAARSLDRAKESSNTDAGKSEGGGNGGQVAFYINNVDVNADNANEFIASLRSEGDTRASHLDVISSIPASSWKV